MCSGVYFHLVTEEGSITSYTLHAQTTVFLHIYVTFKHLHTVFVGFNNFHKQRTAQYVAKTGRNLGRSCHVEIRKKMEEEKKKRRKKRRSKKKKMMM